MAALAALALTAAACTVPEAENTATEASPKEGPLTEYPVFSALPQAAAGLGAAG